jgi:hypothetical protein
VATFFAIPLNNTGRKGSISEKELYDSLSLLFGYVYLTHDDYDGFRLKAAAVKAYKGISDLIKSSVAKIAKGGKVKVETGGEVQNELLDSYGGELIRRMLKAGKTADEVAKNIVMPCAVAMMANNIQQVGLFLFVTDVVCCDGRCVLV